MVNILGINLNNKSKKDVWEEILSLLDSTQQSYLVTPNPEIILESYQDEELFYILNSAKIALADGFGLQLAGLLWGKLIPRITGIDITRKLLQYSNDQGIKIVVIVWNKGLSSIKDIQQSLGLQYPKLLFLVIEQGREIEMKQDDIQKMKDFSPQILFCALGSPEQEKLIFHKQHNWPSVKLSLGVGGSFDFITKKAIRAPKILRLIGLEWLWRLIISPQKRIKRIYRAIIIFPYKVLCNRFINPYKYRPNVACLLYKKEGGKIKILVVERKDNKNHWQIPQGGTERESLKVAGRRELQEELNIKNFKDIATFNNVYRYKFKDRINYPRNTRTYIQNYKGQKQGLYIAKFLGKENDIRINFWDHSNFKWVEIKDIINIVHPIRKQATKIFIDKFKTLTI